MSCFDDLVAQFKDVPKDVIEAIIEKAEDLSTGNKGVSLKNLKEQMPELIAYVKKQRKDQILVDIDNKKRIKKFVDAGKSPDEVIRSIQASNTATGTSLKDSIEINRETLNMRHRNVLEAAWGADAKIAADPKMFKHIIKAMDTLNKGGTVDNGTFKNLAIGARKYNKYIIGELEKAGIPIKDRANYLVRQVHDSGDISRAGFDTWRESIYAKLDAEQTFGNVTKIDKQNEILNEMYNDIVMGNFGAAGPTRLGQRRRLHFKTADDIANYHAEFGGGRSMAEILEDNALSAAKSEAVYKKLGPGGRDSLVKYEKFAEAELKKKGDLKLLEEFRQSKKGRDNLVKQQFGFGEHPSNSLFVTGVKNYKAITAPPKLAFAAASTLTDIAPATANFMAKTGKGFFDSLKTVLTNYVKVLSPKNKKQVADYLLINMSSDTPRFTEGDKLQGAVKKWNDVAMKVTLLDWTTKQNRSSMASVGGSAMGDHITKKRSFDSLTPEMRSELDAFGITTKDWDKILQTEVGKIGSTPFLDIGAIKDRALSIKMANYIWHNAKFGAIAPGDAAKAFATFGVDPKSNLGAAVSLGMQFKSFSMEATRAIQEIVKSNPHANNTTFAQALKTSKNRELLGSIMVLGFTGASISLWVRDLANGKTPRDVDGDFFMEALGRGVMPIWASYGIDILKGESATYGRSTMVSILGPAAGDADQIFNIIGSLTNNKNVGGKTAKLIKRNLPLVNSPLIAPVLNKIFFDSLMDEFSPGYSRRKRKRDAEKGQRSFIPL